MNEPKERPILFSGEMVRAILDGRKRVTRRVVKFWNYRFPDDNPNNDPDTVAHVDGGGNWIFWSGGDYPGLAEFTQRAYPNGEGFVCPYGRVGDLLWVKEAYKLPRILDGLKPSECWPQIDNVLYLADGRVGYKSVEQGKYRHARFMPRWASRLTLRVTAVRVERVQDVTEEQALLEGVGGLPDNDKLLPHMRLWDDYTPKKKGDGSHTAMISARASFRTLWDSINSGRGYSWDSNPFVWVVGFEVKE